MFLIKEFFKKPKPSLDETYEKKFKNIFNRKNIKILKALIKEKNKQRLKSGFYIGRKLVDTRIKMNLYETWIDIVIPNHRRSISNTYQNLASPERAHLYQNRGDLRCEIISEKKILIETCIYDNKNHTNFKKKQFSTNKPDLILKYVVNQIKKIEKEGYGSNYKNKKK